MNEKTKKIVGWVLAGGFTAFMAMSAIMKLSGSEEAAGMLSGFGFSESEIMLIGIGELVSVLLFLIPKTSSAGLILLSAYLGGAIATHMQQPEGKDDNYMGAAIFLIAMWIISIIRNPGTLASFKN